MSAIDEEIKPNQRLPVDAEAITNLATRLAGTISPIDPAADAVEFEALMKDIEALRRLPIKTITPPLLFRPKGISDA